MAEPSARLPLSEGVRGTIRERLLRLPRECRRAVEVASVVGDEFETAVVAAILDAPPAAIADRLGIAVGASILREASGAPGDLRFAHSLFRKTVYDDRPRAEAARVAGADGFRMASDRLRRPRRPSRRRGEPRPARA